MLLGILTSSQLIHSLQLLVLFVNLSFSNSINNLYQIAFWIIINSPAQLNLCFNLIALSACNVTHGVSEAGYLDIEALVCSNCYILPACNLLNNLFILPVTINNLVIDAQTAVYIAIFSVTMSTLMEVHVVKVNIRIWNFVEILSCQMKQRLLQQLSSTNPILSWRECVHPGNNTCYVIIIINVLHQLSNLIRGSHNSLEHNSVRQLSAGIQSSYNFLSICSNTLECLFTIQVLASCNKPEFIISNF